MEKRLLQEEWVALFKQVVQGGVLPGWLMEGLTGGYFKAVARDVKPELSVTVVAAENLEPEIVSAINMADRMGIFGNLPRMTEDSESEEEGESLRTAWEVEVPDYVVKALRVLQRKAKRVEKLWNPSFQEVERTYVELVSDLQLVRATGLDVKRSVGAPTRAGGSTTVWKTLEAIQADIVDGTDTVIELKSVVANNREAVAKMRHDTYASQEAIEELKVWWEKVEGRLAAAEDKVELHARRFANIRPVLALVRGLAEQARTGATSGDGDRIVRQLESLKAAMVMLKNKVDSGSESAWNMLGNAGDGRLEEAVRDINAKVRLLEQRVVGDRVQIGSRVFQLFEDLKAWVVTELPNGRYGLFVDAVSLLDFFAFTGFTDSEKSIAAMHNSQKTGFTTMYEARATATLQNVFPLIFGKGASSGLDDSEYLPAISDPDKWDNGVTGIKHQISRSMGDVEYQLETAIDSTFRDVPETRQIARDCLYGAKCFVTDMCVFISGDYNRWQLQGHSKKEASKITSVCVWRMFEEMFSVRVVARDVRCV